MQSTLLTSAFSRLRESLRLKAAAMLGNSDDADDAMQEAFCSLWASKSQPESESHAEALTRTAVRNASIDLLRRRSRFSDEELPEIEAESYADREEVYARVSSIIDGRLSERDRKMLRLREMNGYEWDELAEMFGVTEANARMIVSRARKAVRDEFRVRD